MQIPSGQSVDYQRVTVQTHRMTSYKRNGRTYTSNSQPPNSVQSSESSTSMEQMNMEGRSTVITPRVLVQAEVIPGDSITPGTTHPGDNSDQQFGLIYDVKTDATPLGEVVFYFFVFKTHEDAIKVIGQINAPNPEVWT